MTGSEDIGGSVPRRASVSCTVRRRAGKKQRQRLKDVFATADVDNSGQIDLTFYLGSSVTVGPCEGSVLERLKDMDTDGDGKISKREWEAWFASSLALLSPQESDLVIDEIDGAVQARPSGRARPRDRRRT